MVHGASLVFEQVAEQLKGWAHSLSSCIKEIGFALLPQNFLRQFSLPLSFALVLFPANHKLVQNEWESIQQIEYLEHSSSTACKILQLQTLH